MVRRRFFSAVSNHEGTEPEPAAILRDANGGCEMQPPFAPQDEG